MSTISIVKTTGLDYQSRTDEYVEHVTRTYGLEGIHARILASVAIPVKQYQPVWVAVKSRMSQWWMDYALCLEQAGGKLVTREDADAGTIDCWRGGRYVFLDTQVDMPETRWTGPIGSRCLHLTMDLPPVPSQPIETSKTLSLFRAAVAAEHRRSWPIPAEPDEELDVCLPVLSRLCPSLDNQSLINNICMLPSAHACLYGREELGQQDVDTMYYMMRQTVPWYIRKLLASKPLEATYKDRTTRVYADGEHKFDRTHVEQVTGLRCYPHIDKSRKTDAGKAMYDAMLALVDSGILLTRRTYKRPDIPSHKRGRMMWVTYKRNSWAIKRLVGVPVLPRATILAPNTYYNLSKEVDDAQ